MRVYQKNGRWYLEGMVRKRRYHQAIPEAVTRKDALKYVDILKADLLRGKLDLAEDIGAVPFKVLIDDYLRYVDVNLRSKSTPIKTAKSFLEIWKSRLVRDISPLDIERYKKTRKETVWCEKNIDGVLGAKYVSAATINRELGILSKIFSLGIDNGYIKENPVSKVKKLPVKNKLERHLSQDEEIRMMKVCDNDFSFLNLNRDEELKLRRKYAGMFVHLKPIIVFALNTGARKGEIFNLTWSCVDFERNEISILDTKNGKKNIIPMNGKLRDLFVEKYRTEKHNQYVFTNPETGFKYTDIKHSFMTLCKLAHIEGLRFHDLRHTAATRMVDAGVPLPAVKEILNHSNIQTTMRYAHTLREQQVQAVNALARYCC